MDTIELFDVSYMVPRLTRGGDDILSKKVESISTHIITKVAGTKDKMRQVYVCEL